MAVHKFAIAAFITLSLSACAQKAETTADVAVAVAAAIDQSKICLVTEAKREQVATCKPGQKLMFSPLSWGNEQLPIRFAAHFCDMRYAIVQNDGGVACILGEEAKIDFEAIAAGVISDEQG